MSWRIAARLPYVAPSCTACSQDEGEVPWRAARSVHDNSSGSDSVDLLLVDWFELAPLRLDGARERFCLQPKSAEAIAAGSASPHGPGGISPFQLDAGRQHAQRLGVPMTAMVRRFDDATTSIRGFALLRFRGAGRARGFERTSSPRGALVETVRCKRRGPHL